MKNPILKLSLRAALLSALFYLYEIKASFFYLVLLILFAIYFYYRPRVNEHKFLPEIIISLIGISYFRAIFPDENFVAAIMVGIFAWLIFGLKGIFFIRKKLAFASLIAALAGLFIILYSASFLVLPKFFANLVLFGALYWLHKRFYSYFDVESARSGFVSSIITLLIMELAWIISLLPLNFLGRGALILAGAFALNRLTWRFIRSNIAWQPIALDLSLFAVALVVVLKFMSVVPGV